MEFAMRGHAFILRRFDAGAPSARDRHRGGGHPPTPATPPCVRVRTRRFETVTLTALEQRRKTTRAKIRIGKPDMQGFRMGQMPRAMAASGSIVRQPATHP